MKIRFRKSVLVILMLLVVAVVFAGNNKLSPGTKMFLKQNTVKELKGRTALMTVGDKEFVSAFIHFAEAIDVSVLEELGVMVDAEFASLGVVTAVVPVEMIETVSDLKEVEYIEVGRTLERMMDKASVMSNVDDIHNAVAPLAQAYTGKGVVVGVVDAGFEYDHIAFEDAEGKLRVKRVWNQMEAGTPPAGYDIGVELTTEEEIRKARFSDTTDNIGHATHVAGIAAGSKISEDFAYGGVASSSDLVFVALDLESDVALLNSIKYIIDYAKSEGKPCVVNFSLGSHFGAHDGTSTFDVLCGELLGEGLIAVGAAGNEGHRNIHSMHTSESDKDSMNVLIYAPILDLGDAMMQMPSVNIWGDNGELLDVQIVVYDTVSGEYLYESGIYQMSASGSMEYSDSVVNDEDYFSYTIISNSEDFNSGRPSVLFGGLLIAGMSEDLHIVCGLKVYGGGTKHCWILQSGNLLSPSKGNWSDVDSDYTVSEIGGTGKRMITSGAYVSREGTNMGVVGERAHFSSKGPTADGRVKPDVIAPGSNIVSSITPMRASEEPDNVVVEKDVEGRTFRYGYMQGTSMASPFVTGVVATWLEANPRLTPEDIKEAFSKTTIRDSFTGDDLPNNHYGWGKIDAFAGLVYVLSTVSNESVDIEDVMIAYPNPTEGELNIGFVKSDEDVSFTVYNASGQMVYSQQLGAVVGGTSKLFNLEGLSTGVYVLKLEGDEVAKTFRIVIK